jgi:hypothetical protein
MKCVDSHGSVPLHDDGDGLISLSDTHEVMLVLLVFALILLTVAFKSVVEFSLQPHR